MAWRRAVSYVPQEVTLFHDSVRNNLLWGCAEASEAQVVEALQRAAADFVFALPQGLETVAGDRGIRLSGGERQRLALARVVLTRTFPPKSKMAAEYPAAENSPLLYFYYLVKLQRLAIKRLPSLLRTQLSQGSGDELTAVGQLEEWITR